MLQLLHKLCYNPVVIYDFPVVFANLCLIHLCSYFDSFKECLLALSSVVVFCFSISYDFQVFELITVSVSCTEPR